jgi:hypothetical protein
VWRPPCRRKSAALSDPAMVGMIVMQRGSENESENESGKESETGIGIAIAIDAWCRRNHISNDVYLFVILLYSCKRWRTGWNEGFVIQSTYIIGKSVTLAYFYPPNKIRISTWWVSDRVRVEKSEIARHPQIVEGLTLNNESESIPPFVLEFEDDYSLFVLLFFDYFKAAMFE